MKIKNMLIPGLGQTQYENKTMLQITGNTLAKSTTRQYGNKHAKINQW